VLVAAPLQVGLTLGLGLLAASIHVFLRDTAQILAILFNAWFYLTPIVYPLPLVPERFRGWLELNPLTTLVGLYRQAFLEGRVDLVPRTAPLALGTAVILCAGFWLFRRLKPAFVDEI